MQAESPPKSGTGQGQAQLGQRQALVLLIGVFIAAICGLVYELLAGALSSYLLGSSVTQFSLVIGVFLCAMGVGSFFTQFVRRELIFWFIVIEILVGVVGGATGVVGFVSFAYTHIYQAILYGMVVLVGILIGMEVPLVLRILKGRGELRISVANVLAADYAGALLASVLFPFVLVPHAGLIRGGLLAGLANVGVALVIIWVLRREVKHRLKLLLVIAGSAALLLGSGLVFADRLSDKLDEALFEDQVIYSKRTPYQHVAITRWKRDVRLYLNGALQFSSADEYRYHEVLVHPVMSANPMARNVLILGGGDGMAVREILKHSKVESIDLVDLDPAVTELFRKRPDLTALNGDALNDPRVRIHNEDAFNFLQEGEGAYDVIIADLPDPNTLGLSKLYTRQFYRLMVKRLSESGVFVTQASSPFMTREAFWCIAHTLEAVKKRPPKDGTLWARAYTAHVPSFGQWGFVMASPRSVAIDELRVTVPTKFLNDEKLKSLFSFGKDISEVETPVNDLENHELARLYRLGYERFHN